MKYIFLDVDGVLNNKKHYSKQHKKYGGRFFCEDMPFNPKSLVNLKKIIKKTGAKVVLSSSWRRTTNGMIVLKARLMEYGIKIHSTTPHIDGYRGKEIKKWCEDNIKAEDRILIIDDEMYDIEEFFKTNEIVKVNYNNGLNSIKKYESIKKLNRKEKKSMDETVDLIAGRLNSRNGETLYWKLEKMMPCKLGDFAVVENANGYDLVEICGFITTTKSKASYFSKTKYENMKSVIMIIEKEQLICKKEEN